MLENSLKKRIGKELSILIKNNASVIQISQWADSVYSNHCNQLNTETNDLITKISFMQHGPEFELSQADLESIAKKLQE